MNYRPWQCRRSVWIVKCVFFWKMHRLLFQQSAFPLLLLSGQLTDTLLYDKCPVTHASTPININWGNATILFQNWNLNWSILSADTKTDTKTLVDNLLTHCSTINVQSPTHLFLSIWNEVIKVRLIYEISILENSNWKIWRFSALASKMRSNKKRVPIF